MRKNKRRKPRKNKKRKDWEPTRPKSASNKKEKSDPGKEAELAVVLVVSRWKRAKKLFENNRRIIRYEHAGQNDRLDKGGIDLLIFLDSGLAFPLQIKSRFTRALVRKHNQRYPWVKFIIGVGRLPENRYDKEAYAAIAGDLEPLINKAISDTSTPPS